MKKSYYAITIILLLLLASCSDKSISSSSVPQYEPTTEPIASATEPIATNEDASITSNDYTSEDENIEESTVVSLRDQVFTEVSPFSEGLAWVQYADADGTIITSVINTSGELVFTLDRKIDYYSPFIDGSAFYLYTIDPSADLVLDNVASCVVDREGNVTYSSESEGVRIILGHGDGHFLAIEHVSNFDADEWRFGSIDKDGNTLIDFENYNNEPFLFWNSDKYDYFTYHTNQSGGFLSRCSYLGEGIFDIYSHNGHYVLYDTRAKKVIYSSSSGRLGVKDGFCDGTMVYTYWGNSYLIKQIDTNGNIGSIDSRSPFDKNKVFASAYSEGVFFYDHAYYDLELNVKIDLSKYSDKIIGGGPFKEGYAPLYIRGADGKDYFTIIDSQGNELFEPALGSPAETFSDGYLVVQMDSGCVLYNTQGEKVCQKPYNVLGNITQPNIYNAATVWDIEGTVSKVIDGFFIACKEGSSVPNIFVGVDGSSIGQ